MRKAKSGRWVPERAPKPPPLTEPTETPWGEDGVLRLPAWIEQAGPMPPTWPIELFWMQVGKRTLEGEG